MNLTKPSHIGWNASDQKLEARWSVLRKVHHFRRETLSSGISRVYWNSRYLREESVPVDFKKTFSLQFQITELLNEENHCYLLFTLDDLGKGFTWLNRVHAGDYVMVLKKFNILRNKLHTVVQFNEHSRPLLVSFGNAYIWVFKTIFSCEHINFSFWSVITARLYRILLNKVSKIMFHLFFNANTAYRMHHSMRGIHSENCIKQFFVVQTSESALTQT